MFTRYVATAAVLVCASWACTTGITAPEAPNDSGDPPTPPPSSQFTCTQVIGYSQTAGWYDAGFEAVVDDDAWQLVWRSGGAIDLWADPDFDGWSRPIESPCVASSNAPDRVLLTISANFQSDPDWWAGHIQTVIGHIRDRFPSAGPILLQPVVGGPSHQVCTPDGERASTNHPVIDDGIARVIGGDIVAGFSPEVRACDDYGDFIGHLTADGYAAAAATIGRAYTTN